MNFTCTSAWVRRANSLDVDSGAGRKPLSFSCANCDNLEKRLPRLLDLREVADLTPRMHYSYAISIDPSKTGISMQATQKYGHSLLDKTITSPQFGLE